MEDGRAVMKSATNSRTGGMSKAPGSGQGLALLGVADFCKLMVDKLHHYNIIPFWCYWSRVETS